MREPEKNAVSEVTRDRGGFLLEQSSEFYREAQRLTDFLVICRCLQL